MRRVLLLRLSNSITKPTLPLYYVQKWREMNISSIYGSSYIIARSNITRQSVKWENGVFAANSEYGKIICKAVAIKMKTKDKQEEIYYEYQNQLTSIIPKERKTREDAELRDKKSFKTSEHASIRFLRWKRKKCLCYTNL